jgi:transposase
MRYELSDFEWRIIEPLLPTERRGVKPKRNRTLAAPRSARPGGECMLGVSVEISRYVDDSQPGRVECGLVDALGDEHLFVEKSLW